MVLTLLLALWSGCRGRPAPTPDGGRTGVAVVVLRPTDGTEPRRVEVEVQRTPQEWMRGLMYRQKLDDGRGMLFLGAEPEHHTFWMRNTLIPLDMVFITADAKVLGVVENATPMTDEPREVPGDSLHVLEVPGGWCTRNHIGPGATVELHVP